MTFPKIEEVQATVQTIQAAKKVEADKLLIKQIQERLPAMQETAAEQIREAASYGKTWCTFRAEDDYGSEQPAVQVLQQELQAAGYQATIGNDFRSIEIEWKSPEPDKLDITLELGGQFRGKEKEIRAMIDAALSRYSDSCYDGADQDSIRALDVLVVLLRRSLQKIL